jgi:hypothetical protein
MGLTDRWSELAKAFGVVQLGLVRCSQLLFGDRARESWVEPDLKPFFQRCV